MSIDPTTQIEIGMLVIGTVFAGGSLKKTVDRLEEDNRKMTDRMANHERETSDQRIEFINSVGNHSTMIGKLQATYDAILQRLDSIDRKMERDR